MRPYLPGTAASIGAATAVRLAREGADVAISYVSSAEAADEVVKTIDGPFADEVRSHIALNRYADVTEIAAAICFLVGPDASYVTGTTLNVDGGFNA
jgi:3-oxoacyl-[acyl-carrier protein] reductase